ncbi:TPA: hypothetical protein ACX6QM_001194 [Photobacterium damselae]
MESEVRYLNDWGEQSIGIISCYHLVIYVLSSHGYGQRRITMFQCSNVPMFQVV